MADGLNVVPVGIAYERPVVVLVVLGPLSRRVEHHGTKADRRIEVRLIMAVNRDLTGLQEQQVVFPAVHLPAWLSALNQARLVLGEMYHVTAPDMERVDFRPGNAKDGALVRIHVLGYLLQLMVELES